MHNGGVWIAYSDSSSFFNVHICVFFSSNAFRFIRYRHNVLHASNFCWDYSSIWIWKSHRCRHSKGSNTFSRTSHLYASGLRYLFLLVTLHPSTHIAKNWNIANPAFFFNHIQQTARSPMLKATIYLLIFIVICIRCAMSH